MYNKNNSSISTAYLKKTTLKICGSNYITGIHLLMTKEQEQRCWEFFSIFIPHIHMYISLKICINTACKKHIAKA